MSTSDPIAAEELSFVGSQESGREKEGDRSGTGGQRSKYQVLMEALDEGYCVIQVIFDAAGEAIDYRFLEANRAFQTHTGLVGVQGRTIREILPGRDEFWIELFRKVALAGEMARVENATLAPGRYFEAYGFQVGDPADHQAAVLFRDITDRKRSEGEREALLVQLQFERKLLRQVLEQGPMAIGVFRGNDFVVEFANPLFQALLKGRELIGRRFRDVMPNLGEEVWEVFDRVMATGEPYSANEWRIPYDYNQDGDLEDRWFNVVCSPLREPDGLVSGFVAMATEATEQVRARQELELINRGLEDFASVASHDLQEPLRMIKIHSQFLVRRLGSSATEEHKRIADLIQRGVGRMERLIKDLLSYSRSAHPSSELPARVVNLEEELREAMGEWEARLAERGGEITREPLPAVRGDGAQLVHVFQNLIGNSLKYSHPDRPLRIHIGAQRQADGAVVILVRDNGIGFEPRHAERIFGDFERLHREDAYPGNGLGLAICRRIVERHGGKIWANGEPGAGATFYFSLPAA